MTGYQLILGDFTFITPGSLTREIARKEEEKKN